MHTVIKVGSLYFSYGYAEESYEHITGISIHFDGKYDKVKVPVDLRSEKELFPDS